MTLVELPAKGKEVPNHRQVRLAEAARGRPEFANERRVEGKGTRFSLRGEIDEHDAAVIRNAPSANEVMVLETIEHERHRAGCQPARPCERTCGHRLVLGKQVEAAKVGAIHAKARRDGLVERVERALVTAKLLRDLAEQFGARTWTPAAGRGLLRPG